MRSFGAALVCAALVTACAQRETVPAGSSPSSAASATSTTLVLHWMSFSHHNEPRNQVLFEGGEAGSFTELRLLTVDGAPVATGSAVASANEPMRMCGGANPRAGTKDSYGALRVTLDLSSQQQLSDLIRDPARYRVEVLAGGGWRLATLVNECHAQE